MGMQISRTGQKILSLAMASAMAVCCCSTAFFVNAEKNTAQSENGAMALQIDKADETISYAAYLTKYAQAQTVSKTVSATLGKEYAEFAASGATAAWDITVSQAGFYNLSLTYSAVVDKGKSMNIAVRLDGEYPFEEASRLVLQQRWKDNLPVGNDFAVDSTGNDILPDVVQLADTITYALHDSEGYYDMPLCFYLHKGVNQITIESTGDAFRLYGLAFTPPQTLMTYAEYQQKTQALPHAQIENFSDKIQAEHPTVKSDPSVYAASDKSDPLIEPNDPYGVKRNIIGTTNWKSPGQYLEWSVTVPEDGYYKLGFKYKQTTNRGLYNLRKLYIDDEVPFKESLALRFEYTDGYRMMVPGNADGAYLYHLTAGQHTIRLEVTLGELADTIQAVEANRLKLAEVRQKIVMITSTNPDIYRDYELKAEIPGLVEDLLSVSETLYSLAEQLEAVTGRTGTNAVTLSEVAEKLYNFANKTYTIPEKLSSFTDCISTLASWSNTLKEQLVELDYITVSSADVENPTTKASFFQKVAYEFNMLVDSYTSDYAALNNEEGAVEVWIATGRDQMYILRELVDASQLTVPVQLKLVRTSVTSAIMAGIGPDVVLNLGRTEPVNLGMRGALEPLEGYEGFKEMKAQFSASAFVPYELEDHTYGVPETQVFNMMFVRTDIMKELGLSIPQTWDEFLNTNRILQQNNMEAGLPSDIFATLLYQSGGSYFDEERTKTAFDTPVALDTFKQWVDYYTKYSFSIFKDDYSRFRSGEMPLAIMSYTIYNTLSVAAPEIRNNWTMYPVPGTLREDGTIDRTVASTGGGTACCMLASSDNKDGAWQFIRWWADGATQAAFGNRLEYIMGPASRYQTANQEAFRLLPWSSEETDSILAQWETLIEVPEVPGGYYVSRNLDNAFRASSVRMEDTKESFDYWSGETDKEIQRKREQYGIE